MTRTIRRGILLLLAAAVLAFAAWMLWPRSLGDALDLEDSALSATILTGHVQDGRTHQEEETYSLPAGSGQAEAVLDLLEQSSYHLCWDSLTDANSISGGTMSIHLSGLSAGQEPQTLVVLDGGGQVLFNGRVVRIGYLTQGPAVTLCEQLAAILRGA